MYCLPARQSSASHLSRAAKCTGWHCLTAAERFGILFCAAIAVLLLSLVYMYCLGRACIANKEAQASASGSANSTGPYSRSHGLHISGSVPTLSPTRSRAIAWPGMVSQQPLVVMARPFNRPVLYHGMPLVPSTCQVCPNHQPIGHGQSTFASVPEPRPQPRYQQARDPYVADRVQLKPPGWRRVLHRTLGIPVGKASTIHTESGRTSPTTAHPRPSLSRREYGSLQSRNEMKQMEKGVQRDGSPMKTQGCESGNFEVSSIRSNAATVYSDDFQIISPTPSIDNQPGISCH
jgi:hypothetical protein